MQTFSATFYVGQHYLTAVSVCGKWAPVLTIIFIILTNGCLLVDMSSVAVSQSLPVSSSFLLLWIRANMKCFTVMVNLLKWYTVCDITPSDRASLDFFLDKTQVVTWSKGHPSEFPRKEFTDVNDVWRSVQTEWNIFNLKFLVDF